MKDLWIMTKKKVFQRLLPFGVVRASFNFLVAGSTFSGISYSNLYFLSFRCFRAFSSSMCVCLGSSEMPFTSSRKTRYIDWILNEQQFNLKHYRNSTGRFFQPNVLIFEGQQRNIRWHIMLCGYRLYAMEKREKIMWKLLVDYLFCAEWKRLAAMHNNCWYSKWNARLIKRNQSTYTTLHIRLIRFGHLIDTFITRMLNFNMLRWGNVLFW